jgi:ergothioneine biosynthesis protein EgtB
VSTVLETVSGRTSLLDRYRGIRSTTERLAAPLAVEDYVLQAMPDVSPTKWHLAHVSWFFETFVLEPHAPGYAVYDDRYRYLFNSYYNTVGPQFSRPERGHLSRPTVAEVYAYRAHVDGAMGRFLDAADARALAACAELVTLGLQHEQQHQELLVTDIKYNLGVNPLRPAYHAVPIPRDRTAPPCRFIEIAGGVVMIGAGDEGFAFDNERPRHRVLQAPYALASRPVTNGEYREFVDAGGYRDWRHWLSEGWRVVQERQWEAPLYWERHDGAWMVQTLSGLSPLDPEAPVTHLSYVEADAYARARGCRLPTEAEWERAAAGVDVAGHFVESGILHPLAAEHGDGFVQLYGDVWEWTQSAYAPYPGFRPLDGPATEYNGKFMIGQLVLRGGSCATPISHMRPSYRNFFPPDARWQFSGLRLARDV